MNKLIAALMIVPGLLLIVIMLPIILICICLQKFCVVYLGGAEVQLLFVYWCFATLRGKTILPADEYVWERLL